jgi:flagellar protein FlaG
MNINTTASANVHVPSEGLNTTRPQGTNSMPGTNRIHKVKVVEQTTKPEGKGEEKLSSAEAKEMVENLNEYMDDLQTQLGFSIREDLNKQVVVEIKNRQTNELVKQIPSEELLQIMENMRELTGAILDQSA